MVLVSRHRHLTRQGSLRVIKWWLPVVEDPKEVAKAKEKEKQEKADAEKEKEKAKQEAKTKAKAKAEQAR